MDSAAGDSTSLIQRRMAIDRTRGRGALFVVLGLVQALLIVIRIVISDFDGILLVQGVASVVFVVLGLVDRVAGARRLRELELENGVGAGKQQPIS
jgi:hypothetical protein